MSHQAQTWVDKVGIRDCKNGGELLVLIRVANHTNGEMRGCYASGETLAGECLMGESTVLKHLRRLKAGGVLLPGDPNLVDHIRADRRPPVYDLAGGHEPGCPGKHSADLVCETVIAGVQIEHPSKRPPATGARSEHPQKKRRPAGARSEHPSKETPATGVQIDLSRVFKSSTDSYKEAKLPLSLNAGALNHQPSQPPQKREREAAAPENKTPAPVAGGTAAAVVDAWANGLKACGHQFLPKRAAAIGAEAAELLAAGHDLDHLCRVAEWMGRAKPSWKILEDAMTWPEAPQAAVPRQRPQRAMCERHPAFAADDCARCRRAEMDRQQRGASEPGPVDGMGLLARVRAGMPAGGAQ
ncbi:helix-turn-helix domain-containing protein [Streptomyces sp. NPDC102437]|uniref:helix-turn-helix domain-containing protein n=1 Tax=Streptomyces sp. NPDC102437 TaxID=3366175 RepID=UPI00382032A2